jgi:hypothetical protein
MTSTSIRSLCERAHSLTLANMNGAGPPSVAPVTAQDPLHEILIAEFAARLPAEIAGQMEASQSYEDLNGWLAVGALHSLVENQPATAARFRAELPRHVTPSSAALALVKAYARRFEPPLGDDRWWRADYCGTVLQLATAVAIVAVRYVVVTLIGGFGAAPDASSILASVSGLSVVWAMPVSNLMGLVLLALTAFWLSIEALLGPPTLEWVRRVPAARQGFQPPGSSRSDTFYAAWHAYTIFLLVILAGRSIFHLVQLLRAGNPSLISGAGTVLTVALTLCIASTVARSFHVTCRVGTASAP